MRALLMKPNFRFLTILAIILCASPFAIAQVVTPSFDPTQSVIMPSASGWRDTSVASFTYREGSGSRSLNSSQIYQFDASGYEAGFAYRTGNFFLEGSYANLNTSRTGTVAYDGQINYEKGANQLNLTLVGNDFVTIGLGTGSDTSLDYFDATDDSVSTTQSKTIGSISVKPTDKFYVGLGFERVKETLSNGESVNWNNVLAGVAVELGTVGATQFRAEYALASSSREVNYNPDNLSDPGIHPATSTSYYSLEVMFSGLLFTFSGETKTIDLGESKNENGVTVSSEKEFTRKTGVLWIPAQGGLSLGFYFIDYGRSASYSDDNSLFQINIGYLF